MSEICNHCNPDTELYCTEDKLWIRTVHTWRNLEYKTNRSINQCLTEIWIYTMETLYNQMISNIINLNNDQIYGKNSKRYWSSCISI